MGLEENVREMGQGQEKGSWERKCMLFGWAQKERAALILGRPLLLMEWEGFRVAM